MYHSYHITINFTDKVGLSNWEEKTLTNFKYNSIWKPGDYSEWHFTTFYLQCPIDAVQVLQYILFHKWGLSHAVLELLIYSSAWYYTEFTHIYE